MGLDLSRRRDEDGTARKIPPPIGGKVDVIKSCSISKQERRPETRICRPPPGSALLLTWLATTSTWKRNEGEVETYRILIVREQATGRRLAILAVQMNPRGCSCKQS